MKNTKTAILKVVAKVSNKAAITSANSAYLFGYHQPNFLKKLKEQEK